MKTVTVSRSIRAAEDDLREAMLDLDPFTRAAGFDSVEVDGHTIHVANTVGLAEIELELAVVDEPDADVAYEQREGIFEEMRTLFAITSTADGVEVTATTDFALDVALVGDVLETTVIKCQRRKELNAQLDYLADVAGF